MKINNINSSASFGIKVPVKTAIEAASGMFLTDAKVSYPKKLDLLSKLGEIDARKLYTGEVSEGLRGMARVIKQRHPEIAQAVERIRKECDLINMDRTFFPKDEIIISNKIANMLDTEAKKIGKEEINIDTISLKDLGLEKYGH